MRLDKYLVDNKLFDSRTKAQEAIKNGLITVNNIIKDQPSYIINPDDKITVANHDQYVSRGAYKLLSAINSFKIQFKNKTVLDIGASTGGFSQVVLNEKAKKVYCIDVGKNQLHDLVRNDKRTIVHENCDFRDLTNEMIQDKIDYVVSDLSFISITNIFPKLNELFNYSYKMVLLIKPQFELDQKTIKKFKGIINNSKLQKQAVDKVVNYARLFGFKTLNIIPSDIKGKEGNQEYLAYIVKENK